MTLDKPASATENPNDLDWLSRVTLNNDKNKRYVYTPRLPPPPPPTVAAPLLRGEPVRFLDFLLEKKYVPYLTFLFGDDGTASAKMIGEFRQATDFHYFGHRSTKLGHKPPKNPGLLDDTNAASKEALMEFARLAYRWDPERRGQAFWQQIAKLLWNTYESLMASRQETAEIERREIERIAKLPAKRAKAAARVRKCRANKASR